MDVRDHNFKCSYLMQLAILTILPLMMACSQDHEFEFESDSVYEKVHDLARGFEKEIADARVFTELFVNGYQEVFLNSIPQALLDSFHLAGKKNISAKVVFSTTREAMIMIFPAAADTFYVEATKFPLQLTMLTGLDIEGWSTELNIPVESVPTWYDGLRASIPVEGVSSLINIQIPKPTYKLISFQSHSIVFLSNVTVPIKSDDSIDTSWNWPPVSIMTGETDFGWAIKKARRLGQNYALSEIRSFLFRSDFFRKALADSLLSARAEEIQQNRDRNLGDYPYWEFQRDFAELKHEAEVTWGIVDTTYVDSLLSALGSRSHAGHLLLHYSSLYGFMQQWIAINIFFLFVFIILLKYKHAREVQVLFSHRSVKWMSVLLVANGWVFLSKPKALTLEYWVIPGVLILACAYFALMFGRKNERET